MIDAGRRPWPPRRADLPATPTPLHANTVDAHRLLHLAADERAVQGELKEALLAAYFVEAENVGDHDVLSHGRRRGRSRRGRRRRGARRATSTPTTSQADIAPGPAYGATGVPFFVVDRRYGVSGAQPAETFSQVLDRAWADSHPALEMVGGDADACGPTAARSEPRG